MSASGSSRPRSGFAPPSLQAMMEEEAQDDEQGASEGLQDRGDSSKPLFPLSSESLFPLVEFDNADKPEEATSMPSFSSFSFKKREEKPAAVVVPQAGRRPRASDFFDDSQMEPKQSTSIDSANSIASQAQSQPQLGVITRRVITEYIDESSDEDSSSDVSSSSDDAASSRRDRSKQKHKRHKSSKKGKDKKRDKKDKKSSSAKDKKKIQRHREESNSRLVESGPKRRKISDESDVIAASSSTRDKMKMLELNMKNIKEDPRRQISTDSWLTNPAVVTSQGVTNGWFEDTIGDQNNLQFGLYRGDVPAFHRGKKVIGMPEYKYVKWSKDSSAFRLIDLRYESVAQSASSGSAGVEASHSDRYYFLGSMRDIQQRERDEARRRAQASSMQQHAASAASKTIKKTEFDELKDLVNLQEESDDSETQGDSETFEAFLSRRTKFYNEKTRFDRSNIKIWQEFIQLQDEYAHIGSTRAMILEQKIEIYKAAIEANPHSDELVLGMMQNCAQLYSTDRTTQLWQETIARNPDSALLWKSYLAFVQSNFSSFSVPLLRNIFTAAIKAINRQKRFYQVGIPKHRGLEEKTLAMAIRAIYLEKQSGYHERATSMFQALIEFNLFMPSSFVSDTPREKQLTFFQAFWDTESPRFGDAGAQGWKSWHAAAESKVKSDAMEIIEDYDPMKATAEEDLQRMRELAELEALVREKTQRASEQSEAERAAVTPGTRKPVVLPVSQQQNKELLEWLEQEDEADKAKWTPLRTVAGNLSPEELREVDDDPDRVVFFDDIKEFLFQLSYNDLKCSLIQAFCRFLGFRWDDSRDAESTGTDIEELGELFSLIESLKFPAQCAQVEPMSSEITEATTNDVPFSEAVKIFKSAYEDDELIGAAAGVLPHSRRDFLRNVLSQASEKLPKSEKDFSLFLDEVNRKRIILEGRIAVTPPELAAARTLAKSILKQDSTNLRLWTAYARMEALRGNTKEATKVFQTALANLGKLPAASRFNAPELVCAYVEMLLYATSTKAADITTILVNATLQQEGENVEGASPSVRLLKARKCLEAFLNSSKTSFMNKDSVITSPEIVRDRFICYAFLEYSALLSQVESAPDFTIGQNILSRSIEIFDQGLRLFFLKPNLARHHERLSCAKSLLVMRETIRPSSSVRPMQLRTALDIALRQYPSNQFLLSMVLFAEQKQQILGRMRLLFDTLLESKNATPITWLFALRSETKQGAGNRCRTLFERAVTQMQQHSASALVWKFYIDFEIAQNRIQAAKGVFFRAIRLVPWSKSMWLYCLRRLSAFMSLPELSDVFSLLTDKEIRLRSTPPL